MEPTTETGPQDRPPREPWMDRLPKDVTKWERWVLVGAAIWVLATVLVAVGRYLGYSDSKGLAVMALFGDAMATPALLATAIALFISTRALLMQRVEMNDQIEAARRSAQAQREIADLQTQVLQAQLESARALRESAAEAERNAAPERLGRLLEAYKAVVKQCNDLRDYVKNQKAQWTSQGVPDERARQLRNERVSRCLALQEQVGNCFIQWHNHAVEAERESAVILGLVAAESEPRRQRRIEQTEAWVEEIARATETLKELRRKFEEVRAMV